MLFSIYCSFLYKTRAFCSLISFSCWLIEQGLTKDKVLHLKYIGFRVQMLLGMQAA